MKQIKYFYVAILLLSLFVSVNFYFKSKALQKEFSRLTQMKHNVDLIRDFNLYKAFKENNLTEIDNNIKLNFMFHLKPIETDGIDKTINITNTYSLCLAYKEVSLEFKNEYQNKYPLAISEIDRICQ